MMETVDEVWMSGSGPILTERRDLISPETGGFLR